jgi:hypothetical protein
MWETLGATLKPARKIVQYCQQITRIVRKEKDELMAKNL